MTGNIEQILAENQHMNLETNYFLSENNDDEIIET